LFLIYLDYNVIGLGPVMVFN